MPIQINVKPSQSHIHIMQHGELSKVHQTSSLLLINIQRSHAWTLLIDCHQTETEILHRLRKIAALKLNSHTTMWLTNRILVSEKSIIPIQGTQQARHITLLRKDHLPYVCVSQSLKTGMRHKSAHNPSPSACHPEMIHLIDPPFLKPTAQHR